MKIFRLFALLASILLNYQVFANSNIDPLPSWNETQTKKTIIQFVQQTTSPNSQQFIPVSKRIATFDNDGTLWAEKPIYFQFYYTIDTIKKRASHHPEWKTTEPFASILKGDISNIKKSNLTTNLKLMSASHSGMNTDEFEASVNEWLKTARHPKTKRLFSDMVYQPMLELLQYLQDNEFKVFIASGGGADFMRAWAPKLYGIPKERILGSSMKTKYKIIDGKPQVVRTHEVGMINNHDKKPSNIQTYIGTRPVIAGGNSDGDLEMLYWTKSSPTPSLVLLLHHTDNEREWAYDKNSAIGHLKKALSLAEEDNWTVIDMKKDWKQIFPK